MNRIRKLSLRRRPSRTRGQSLVEFALVSVVLFMLMLGILEAGRFLFTYSVISNAAQEGSRFGIVRPRDAVPNARVTYVAGQPTYNGTPIPTALVVPDGICNVVDRSREKVFGVSRDAVQINFWYDDGGGTPTPVTTANLENVVIKGKRIVVQSSYTFRFIVPFMSKFVPNGVRISMRSGRTMVNNGDYPRLPCAVDYTPAPTPNLGATQTAAAAATQTVRAGWTPTPTNTPTITPTPYYTPTPYLNVAQVLAYKNTGSGTLPLNVTVHVTDGAGGAITGASVSATMYDCSGNPCVIVNTVTLPDVVGYAGYYRMCPVGSYSIANSKMRVGVTVTKAGYAPGSATGFVQTGVACPPP